VGLTFLSEIIIAFILMTVILHVSNDAQIHKFTGLCAGILVAAYFTVEAPISGMSMNPARSIASAFSAQDWAALWIYFTAPLIGMLFAAEIYAGTKGRQAGSCAKLRHENHQRCIFCGKPPRKYRLAKILRVERLKNSQE
jgi:aquaporin Z